LPPLRRKQARVSFDSHPITHEQFVLLGEDSHRDIHSVAAINRYAAVIRFALPMEDHGEANTWVRICGHHAPLWKSLGAGGAGGKLLLCFLAMIEHSPFSCG
jgi:hypothetical protein